MDALARLPVALFRRIDADPRHWQILALAGLFLFSYSTSSFGAEPSALIFAFSGAMLAQGLGTAGLNLRAGRPLLHGFEAKSALITMIGVTVLLRAAAPWIWFAAAFTGISLKFLVRIKGKHVFNPGCIGIVMMMLVLGRDAWVSPGQWGQMPLIAGYALALAALTLSSAKRLDIALGFLFTFAAILFARAAWLGDPVAIPLHQLSSGSLLIFAFFMITDPRSTPDSRAGRILFAMAVAALAAWFIIGPNQRGAPLMALAALGLLTPLLDRALPAHRFEWPHGTPAPDRIGPIFTLSPLKTWGTKET
ncbi:MAG: RnfABCDGE type electron transport complex subunit D [Hyphomonas oceanitis]|uniref:RnfABCDGE type electron transport complex subunit D n=1 Tax=Hyphomonas oceanitis TaxID=81033 RepID=UPI003003A14C